MIRAFLSLLISARRNGARNEVGVVPLSLYLSLCAGDALSSLKALRDAGRFVGKEDTVPLRLLYSRHNHSQITQDELSTRIKASASSDSTQVHKVLSCCEGGVCDCGKMPLCLQLSILSIQPLPTCPHGWGESLFSKQGYKKRTLTTF